MSKRICLPSIYACVCVGRGWEGVRRLGGTSAYWGSLRCIQYEIHVWWLQQTAWKIQNRSASQKALCWVSLQTTFFFLNKQIVQILVIARLWWLLCVRGLKTSCSRSLSQNEEQFCFAQTFQNTVHVVFMNISLERLLAPSWLAYMFLSIPNILCHKNHPWSKENILLYIIILNNMYNKAVINAVTKLMLHVNHISSLGLSELPLL